ncbi:hypothetical protein D3C77_325140 [compost metagenome]
MPSDDKALRVALLTGNARVTGTKAQHVVLVIEKPLGRLAEQVLWYQAQPHRFPHQLNRLVTEQRCIEQFADDSVEIEVSQPITNETLDPYRC